MIRWEGRACAKLESLNVCPQKLVSDQLPAKTTTRSLWPLWDVTSKSFDWESHNWLRSCCSDQNARMETTAHFCLRVSRRSHWDNGKGERFLIELAPIEQPPYGNISAMCVRACLFVHVPRLFWFLLCYILHTGPWWKMWSSECGAQSTIGLVMLRRCFFILCSPLTKIDICETHSGKTKETPPATKRVCAACYTEQYFTRTSTKTPSTQMSWLTFSPM